MLNLPQNRKNLLNKINTIIVFAVLWAFFASVSVGIRTAIIGNLDKTKDLQISNAIFSLYEVHNSGAAFSLFSEFSSSIIIASVLSLIILVLIIFIYAGRLNKSSVTAVALLCGGISVNLAERIKFKYVIDYIALNFLPSFPVFNISDIMIVTGAFWLVFSILLKNR